MWKYFVKPNNIRILENKGQVSWKVEHYFY
jgi:hypothetical protein